MNMQQGQLHGRREFYARVVRSAWRFRCVARRSKLAPSGKILILAEMLLTRLSNLPPNEARADGCATEAAAASKLREAE